MDGRSKPVRLQVLGGFEVTYNERPTPLPLGAQRLLALLALDKDGIQRTAAGERLWPDSPNRRAAANLRSALWRARHIRDLTVVECAGPRLILGRYVEVDIHEVFGRYRGLCAPRRIAEDADDPLELIRSLTQELLPDWPDEWLVIERQRWQELRLRALETLARRLASQHRYLDAVQAALAATSIDPIRESSHRIVVEIHIAEGNTASAFRHYQQYRALLQRELGVTPSEHMDQLVSKLTSG